MVLNRASGWAMSEKRCLIYSQTRGYTRIGGCTMNKNIKRICPLCGKEKENIRKSHVVPKFVGKYQKNTSIGNIRNSNNPNVPAQDIYKKYLLCGDCEELFSKYETWFAKNVFRPYKANQKIKALTTLSDLYKLYYFLVSVVWRYLYINKNDIIGEIKNSALDKSFKKALDEMKDFLINEKENEIINNSKHFKVIKILFPENYYIPYPKAASNVVPEEAWLPNTVVHEGIIYYLDVDHSNGRINVLINMMGVAVNCYISDIPDKLKAIGDEDINMSVCEAVMNWIYTIHHSEACLTENSKNKLNEKFNNMEFSEDDYSKPLIRDLIYDKSHVD